MRRKRCTSVSHKVWTLTVTGTLKRRKFFVTCDPESLDLLHSCLSISKQKSGCNRLIRSRPRSGPFAFLLYYVQPNSSHQRMGCHESTILFGSCVLPGLTCCHSFFLFCISLISLLMMLYGCVSTVICFFILCEY